MKTFPVLSTDMNNNRLATQYRYWLLVCALGLLAVLFTPIWRIDLQAPQYPEGLRMQIYANSLQGNIDIINGLNHYIGMQSLHAADFPEFLILPWIILFFIALFVITAVLLRRNLLFLLLILYVGFGILAMIDFWRWEYHYGHNLNPAAAIVVPGMSYQPPLIGFKQLLNFGAYSVPDIGGWLFIGVGVLLLWVVFKNRKKPFPFSSTHALLLLFICTVSILTGCSSSPEPLVMGADNCTYCKMKLTDNRFGAELITRKYKVFKFDDAHCILSYIRDQHLSKESLAGIYFTDFDAPHTLINFEQAVFFQSPNLHSPMNGNIAAFRSLDSLEKIIPVYYGNRVSWEEMQK